jgi:glycine/sarcosine N-methyltransferase
VEDRARSHQLEGGIVANTIPGFYNELAPYYHLIFEDWERSIERQARALNSLLETYLGAGSLKILDCSCGIGTQSIGFAGRGHRVVGSDVSAAAVERARQEFEARGLNGLFLVSDMTSLADVPERDFDVVVTLDNALPHLSPAKVRKAVRAMHGKLKPGGLMMASIRDYDAGIRERPAVQGPVFYGPEGQRRIVLQVWDWIEHDLYVLHLIIVVEQDGGWATHHFVSSYRALQRGELSEALASEGFADIRWRMPEETGYYIPMVLARKSN